MELATIAFGQSFQITPVQLAATVSALINGGTRVTPHFGVRVLDEEGGLVKTLEYETEEGIVSRETSAAVRQILESVVSEGSGKKRIHRGVQHRGPKQLPPRRFPEVPTGTSLFPGIRSAEDPQVLALCVIHDPREYITGEPLRPR